MPLAASVANRLLCFMLGCTGQAYQPKFWFYECVQMMQKVVVPRYPYLRFVAESVDVSVLVVVLLEVVINDDASGMVHH